MNASSFRIADWSVEPARNRIARDGETVDLEPKVMDLLVFLADRPGETVRREVLADALWPGLIVNEDALSRTIFKLRKALGDDARAPRYVETIPKRGVRLIAAVAPAVAIGPVRAEPHAQDRGPDRSGAGLGVSLATAALALIVCAGVLWFALGRGEVQPGADDVSAAQEDSSGAAAMLRRADGFYTRFTRSDNEAALALYEDLLSADPGDAAAMAGLANALTQRMIRFGGPDGLTADRRTLGEALDSGWLDTPEARAAVDRAADLALAATEADPGHARAWRALGLAEAARRNFDAARRAHERALVMAPGDWGALVNLADISQLTGRDDVARAYMVRAFDAMELGYDADPVAIGAWQAEIGVWVARSFADAGEPAAAELWYRRVLAIDPVNAEAVRALAGRLRTSGDLAGARALCAQLERRTGTGCAQP